MKVLIVNQHTNNFGDDGAGVSVIKNLLNIQQVEKVEVLYCMPGQLPIDDDRVIHNHSLNVRTLRRIDYILFYYFGISRGSFIPGFLKKLEEYDVVLVSPCGANLGIYKDWQLLYQDLIVTKCKKKLIFHLNTISPSGNWFFDHMVIKLCKKSFTYVREKASLHFLEHNNVKVKFGTDSAFSMPSEGSITQLSNVVSFVPSDVWSWHVNFKNRNRSDVESLILNPLGRFLEKNHLILNILPHTNSSAEKEYNISILNYFKQHYPNVIVNLLTLNSVFDYENSIRESAMVVGMRYHAIVFSVKNHIPFVGLAYEQKMKEVSKYSGLEKNCLDLTSLHANDFSLALDRVWSSRLKIEEELFDSSRYICEKSLIVMKEQFGEQK